MDTRAALHTVIHVPEMETTTVYLLQVLFLWAGYSLREAFMNALI